MRGVDTDGRVHAIPVTSGAVSLTMSAKRLHTVSLGALASSLALGLRDLSLAANALYAINLAPLSWCPSLVALTLNSNRLSHIDLSPLSSCKQLERLWLHDNCLECLDLMPLTHCSKLRSLYVEDNSIDRVSLDLMPLQNAAGLRSLRVGGNKLDGMLNLTPLVTGCPALSVFNVDAAVKLQADVEPSTMRRAPAMRRIVLDVKFNPPPIHRANPNRRVKGVTTPPVSPPSIRRSSTAPTTTSAQTSTSDVTKSDSTTTTTTTTTSTTSAAAGQSNKTPAPASTPPVKQPVIKVLLIGFRRLARYAAEDSLSKCGKVVIRASTNSVTTSDPSLLLDSHIVLLYSPQEKTVRQVRVVAGRMPIVVIGTERYRSSADTKLYELVQRLKFFIDPIDIADAKLIYHLGLCFATGDTASTQSILNNSSYSFNNNNSKLTPNNIDNVSSPATALHSIRKSRSTSKLPTSTAAHPCTDVGGIELEDIEDVVDVGSRVDGDTVDATTGDKPKLTRTQSTGDIDTDAFGPKQVTQSQSSGVFCDARNRLHDMRLRRPRADDGGLGGFGGGGATAGLSVNGRNKLRAERSAIESAFTELGGYVTGETCSGIARICGLAKCAAPLLFRSALGSTFEVESTTPEAGVPNAAPMERKKRISCDAFLAYWDSRLKLYDGEERLSNILEDSHFTKLGTTTDPDNVGHSPFGARVQRAKEIYSEYHDNDKNNNKTSSKSTSSPVSIDLKTSSSAPNMTSSTSSKLVTFLSTGFNLGPAASTANMSTEMWCPCDAGIEELVRVFMEGRATRFGAYALVKLSEAVAIGAALVIHGVREAVRGRVGGRARAVCPKEVKRAKLNAALVAAEVGIFEGVVAGLSMTQIRTIKGSFATEVAPATISLAAGCALSWTLSVDEVQHFCVSRKTLLPMAVDAAMRTHCRDPTRMSLSEFAVLLAVLNNVAADGAVDYFFSIIDIDQDEKWSVADVRHFHMEKERLWLDDGMAVSDLHDLWINLLDMIGAQQYQSRMDASPLSLSSITSSSSSHSSISPAAHSASATATRRRPRSAVSDSSSSTQVLDSQVRRSGVVAGNSSWNSVERGAVGNAWQYGPRPHQRRGNGRGPRQWVSRRDVFKLGEKDRKTIIQTLLFVDDEYSSVNIRRTMELSKKSTTAVGVM